MDFFSLGCYFTRISNSKEWIFSLFLSPSFLEGTHHERMDLGNFFLLNLAAGHLADLYAIHSKWHHQHHFPASSSFFCLTSRWSIIFALKGEKIDAHLQWDLLGHKFSIFVATLTQVGTFPGHFLLETHFSKAANFYAFKSLNMRRPEEEMEVLYQTS